MIYGEEFMSQLRWQSIAKGLGTMVPLVDRLANSAAGSPVGARYFYSVWLRHLTSVAALRPGLCFDVVAELGPGDALGLGICALFSGAKRYIGLDLVPFGLSADNLPILDEIYELFQRREPIPDDDEFPRIYPKLTNYAFPQQLLTDDLLAASLAPERVIAIRQALMGDMRFTDNAIFSYTAPWNDSGSISPGKVDLLLSQAVMEHVDDIDGAYAAMRRWLKPQGVMSHRIDYTSHGIARDWYGHWTVSPALWRVVRGHRAYLINRLPHSAHIAAMNNNGFEILASNPTISEMPAPGSLLRVPYEPADLSVKGAFVVAESIL
jgi:SAM-dependent methyltransferase